MHRYKLIPFPRKDTKIVWYDFRRSVPQVDASKASGPAPTPQGQKDPSGEVLIVQSENAASSKQLIRQPDHPEPLPTDVPAPNLVALQPKKAFTPPPAQKPRTAAELPSVSEAPVITELVSTGNALGALSLPKLPPKAFTAPTREAGHAPRTASLSEPPPPSDAGIDGLKAVIIGLNPSAGLPPLGSRSAQFARAPVAGTPSSGAASQTSGTVMAGVVAHGRPGEQPKLSTDAPALPPSGQVLKQINLPRINRTMSAPLRPSSRIVPPTVEAQFADRDLFTLVIPAPDVQGYKDDWVLWFSERGSSPEAGSRISAPIPSARLASTTNASMLTTLTAGSVQFAAIIDKIGHLSAAKVIRTKTDLAFRARALAELQSWEFKPALRNGEPIEVDVVLEIPFQFPVQ